MSTLHKAGYILVYAKDHPNAYKNGQILEHRLIMSQFLGRPLRKNEVVHHKNTTKTDNDISNLMLIKSTSEHSIIHRPKQKCSKCNKWCKSDGLCSRHYSRLRYSKKTDFLSCDKCRAPIPPNPKIAKDGKSLCRKCRYPVKTCKFCNLKSRSLGMCLRHCKQWYYQKKRGLTYNSFVRSTLAG